MKIRYKKTGSVCYSSRFNPCGIGEVLTPEDSAFIRELDVWVNGQWKDMSDAFTDHDIITDNHNLSFFEPLTEEDRKRGFTL